MSQSLALKVKTLHVYANGYKIGEFDNSEFGIDKSDFDSKFPLLFSEEVVKDPG